jgi:hypothetical protein
MSPLASGPLERVRQSGEFAGREQQLPAAFAEIFDMMANLCHDRV